MTTSATTSGLPRVQLALNVDDLDAAVDFYAKLLGVPAAKYDGLSDALASAVARLEASGKLAEQALVLAAASAWTGQPERALQHADRLLAMTPDDSSGWSLPADPMFAPLRRADGYARLAARLAARAA